MPTLAKRQGLAVRERSHFFIIFGLCVNQLMETERGGGNVRIYVGVLLYLERFLCVDNCPKVSLHLPIVFWEVQRQRLLYIYLRFLWLAHRVDREPGFLSSRSYKVRPPPTANPV